MGSHSRKGHRPKSRKVNSKKNQNNNNNNNNNNNADNNSNVAVHNAQLPATPPCVSKLQSPDWSVVEEGCADIAAFALRPTQHANLVALGVPQRLAEILFTTSNACKHDPGVFYVQTAAAEALRNFVVNSVEDAVVDALALCSFPACTQQTEGENMGERIMFRDALVALMMSTWGIVQETRRDAPTQPQPPAHFVNKDGEAVSHDAEAAGMNENENENHVNNNNNNNSPFILASRTLEEVLQLISVCVESNEHIAEAFSVPLVLNTLLSMLDATTGIIWGTLQHPAQLYRATTVGTNDVMWLRQYKRREAELLAAIAVVGSEVLHVLSGDNEALASLLQSSELMAAHQTFLTNSLDATFIMRWLREELPSSLSLPVHASSSSPAAMGEGEEEEKEDDIILLIIRQNILYQLCEVSLHVQGTLMNSISSTTNAARVLPLVVAVLDAHPPHNEWRRTVPLLLKGCTFMEEHRHVLIHRALWRLRCDQAAVNVLHTVVDIICGLNEPDKDDEAAFQENLHASLLYSTNAMYVVGKLMKDALRLTADNNNNNNNNNNRENNNGHVFLCSSVNCEDDVIVERALRTAAGTSGTGGMITKLQLLVLSNEVGVWSLANTLLMMVPWSSLGEEPSHIWRAIMNALTVRSHLLSEARAEEVHEDTHGDGTAATMMMMNTTTSAGMNLLRLQLESLLQMLWTLQRKQTLQAGGPLHVSNQLSAVEADVDVVTRLAWDSHATPLQKQACVGVVCAVCKSFKNAEATCAAARFAMGVLHVDEGLQANSTSVLSPPTPSTTTSSSSVLTENKGSKREAQWIEKITAVDAQWRVRCEASNHIMDLFLDETHDAAVYIPLGVHASLRSFLGLFQAYVKRRQHVVREAQRNYRVSIPEVDDAAHWREVIENLTAFLEYKTEHIGR